MMKYQLEFAIFPHKPVILITKMMNKFIPQKILLQRVEFSNFHFIMIEKF